MNYTYKYPIVLIPHDSMGYLVLIPDLIGCIAKGETAEQALGNTSDAISHWMNLNVRCAADIPKPSDTETVLERYELFITALAIADEDDPEIKYIDIDTSPWRLRSKKS